MKSHTEQAVLLPAKLSVKIIWKKDRARDISLVVYKNVYLSAVVFRSICFKVNFGMKL